LLCQDSRHFVGQTVDFIQRLALRL
jgi:hypothetical protein